MVEAMPDFLPAGSRERTDLAEYRTIGPFQRQTTMPIDVAMRSEARV